MIDQAFWRGKKVFLTGHTGFKELADALVTGAWHPRHGLRTHAGHHASNLFMFMLGRVNDGIESIIGDIWVPPLMAEAMKAASPDIVIHMAAQLLVRESYVNPVETYETNVMGTVHVLDAIRQVPGVRSVVIITTDKCYENREWEWGYRENEAMGGYDPYSSKGCAELVTSAYRNSFFNPAATTNMALPWQAVGPAT